MNDDGRLAEELFDSGYVFFASIVPGLLSPELKTEEEEEICGRIHPTDNFYPEWAKKIFKENKDNSNVWWVQEGYRHCCGRCFNKKEISGKNSPDPHHEHVCLDGIAQSLEKQIEVIARGKQILKEELGIVPKIYCPPNHMYNKDTLKAARANRFSYFFTRNGFDYFFPQLIELPCHEEEGLTIFTETKYGKSPARMAYYDKDSEELLKMIKSSQPLTAYYDNNVSKMEIGINKFLIGLYKRLRDLK